MSLLGLDAGTTGCKAVAFDDDGAIVAQAYREYPLDNPQPGFYELDADVVWAHLADCIREVNARLAGNPIEALAISAQGEAVIPVGADGQALAPSPVSSDLRGIAQAKQLEAQLGVERVYDITGQPPTPLYSLTKVMWWQQHAPDVFAQAWKFLCYGDFIALRLGVTPIIDWTMAARTLAFDIRAHTWSLDVLAAAHVPVEKLPDAAPSGTVIGEIPAAIREQLGFTRPVQVVTGGHDQPCAALGAGVLRPGEAMYSIGTTEAIALAMDAPHPNLKKLHFPCYPHVLPDTYVTLFGSQTGGRLLRWYRDVLGAEERDVAARDGRDVYDVMTAHIDDAPGKLLLLPYFSGSGSLYDDAHAKGAILGLTFDTQRADLIKAILEGVTFEQALSIRHLRAADVAVDRFLAVGGGARSAVWLQIKADILDRPVRTTQVTEAACLGAAALAGWAVGKFDRPQQWIERTTTVTTTYFPRADHAAFYQQRLTLYEQFARALQPFYRQL